MADGGCKTGTHRSIIETSVRFRFFTMQQGLSYGDVVFEKNSLAVVPIASVTKLRTSMVVLDSKASLTEEIQVTDADRNHENTRKRTLDYHSRYTRRHGAARFGASIRRLRQC